MSRLLQYYFPGASFDGIVKDFCEMYINSRVCPEVQRLINEMYVLISGFFWSGFNKIKSNNDMKTIIHNGSIINDKSQIVNALKEYFLFNFNNLKSKSINNNSQPETNYVIIDIPTITIDDVIANIKEMKSYVLIPFPIMLQKPVQLI